MTDQAGFEDGAGDDAVGILGNHEPLLASMFTPDGRWLVPNVTPQTDPAAVGRSVAVVVDSGVRSDHPSLRGRILEEINLTREANEDLHGHGTAVAAILAATYPQVDIVSIKALDQHGRSTVPLMSLAFRRAAEVVTAHQGRVVSVSAGRRDPRCRGTCALCATVTELQADNRAFFVCAAGNTPGVTYCPAQVAFSVTTGDDWAAPGDFRGPVPQWVPDYGRSS